jgi:hypothetical protein
MYGVKCKNSIIMISTWVQLHKNDVSANNEWRHLDFGFLVIVKQGFSTTSLEKLKSWFGIYKPIRRFVNILTTLLCPSFTRFTHVLTLRNVTASLTRGLWLEWQICLWLSEGHAETQNVSKCEGKLKLKSVCLKNQYENLATLCTETYLENGGTRWRSWLGHGATIRKVACSLKFFIDIILPAALSTQSLTGKSTRSYTAASTLCLRGKDRTTN